jgi:hypothetical protein
MGTTVTVLVACVLFAGCGSDAPSTASAPIGSVSGSTAAAGDVATTLAPSAATTTATDAHTIVNTWVGPPADVTALPIGTSHVSTSAAAVGALFACSAGNPSGGGAFAVGPWVDQAADTWDMTTKVSVQGDVGWPMAKYSEVVQGADRLIASNGLPTGTHTGTFPIGAGDPAYSYDRNPNSIGESAISLTLAVTPRAAAAPMCLPMGAIGVFRNGVAAFASLDALNRDAVAYETQDSCEGHPERSSTYHYHNIPSCLLNATTGASSVVGFANDGYPFVVERDAAGNLPTDADLDECHGRTSPVLLDGNVVEIYHYSATYEFPYFIGCFHGTPVKG